MGSDGALHFWCLQNARAPPRSAVFLGTSSVGTREGAFPDFRSRHSPVPPRVAHRRRCPKAVPGSRPRASRTGNSPRSTAPRAYRCRRRSRGANWRCRTRFASSSGLSAIRSLFQPHRGGNGRSAPVGGVRRRGTSWACVPGRRGRCVLLHVPAASPGEFSRVAAREYDQAGCRDGRTSCGCKNPTHGLHGVLPSIFTGCALQADSNWNRPSRKPGPAQRR